MPQRRFASIHVVGTNGKSSTARFIAAILERHGLRTGQLHLAAPALVRGADRGGGGGRCPRRRFAAAVARAAHAAELVDRTAAADDRVTQFEALTAAAYHELARAGVEVAVIEAGLGGRYDATNVIPSKVQVLTSVGLEHTRWLGPTVPDIAEEKLAVVRDHATLVVGSLEPEATRSWPSGWPPSGRRGSWCRARRQRGRKGQPARRRRLPAPQLRARRGRRRGLPRASARSGGRRSAAPQTRIAGRLEILSGDPADDPRRRPQPVRGRGPGRGAPRGGR